MEPIGLCGGGLVALALILVAIIGVALLGGGVVLFLAKLGALVDAWRRPDARSGRTTTRWSRATYLRSQMNRRQPELVFPSRRDRIQAHKR